MTWISTVIPIIQGKPPVGYFWTTVYCKQFSVQRLEKENADDGKYPTEQMYCHKFSESVRDKARIAAYQAIQSRSCSSAGTYGRYQMKTNHELKATNSASKCSRQDNDARARR